MGKALALRGGLAGTTAVIHGPATKSMCLRRRTPVDGDVARSAAVTDPDGVLAQRKRLAERFSVARVAYSSDGREVGFAGPIELGVEVGGLAMIDVPDGGHLVVQVRDLRIVELEGLSIDVDVSDVVPGAGSASVRPRFRSLSGSAVVLGRLDATGFTALAATAPFGELPFRQADSDEVVAIVDALDGDAPTVELGTVAGTSAPARLRATGFARTRSCAVSRARRRRAHNVDHPT